MFPYNTLSQSQLVAGRNPMPLQVRGRSSYGVQNNLSQIQSRSGPIRQAQSVNRSQNLNPIQYPGQFKSQQNFFPQQKLQPQQNQQKQIPNQQPASQNNQSQLKTPQQQNLQLTTPQQIQNQQRQQQLQNRFPQQQPQQQQVQQPQSQPQPQKQQQQQQLVQFSYDNFIKLIKENQVLEKKNVDLKNQISQLEQSLFIKGQLTIKIVGANDLVLEDEANAELSCAIYTSQDPTQQLITKTVRGTSRPRFFTEGNLQMTYQTNQISQLQLIVQINNEFQEKKLVGQSLIDLKELLQNPGTWVNKIFELKNNSYDNGVIYLQLIWNLNDNQSLEQPNLMNF